MLGTIKVQLTPDDNDEGGEGFEAPTPSPTAIAPAAVAEIGGLDLLPPDHEDRITGIDLAVATPRGSCSQCPGEPPEYKSPDRLRFPDCCATAAEVATSPALLRGFLAKIHTRTPVVWG